MKPEKTKEYRKKKFENECTQISEKRSYPKQKRNEDKRCEEMKTERYTAQPRRQNKFLQRAQSFASAESTIYLSKFRATRDWVFQHSTSKNVENNIDRGHSDKRLVHGVGLQRSESLRPVTHYDQVNSFTGSSSGVYEDLYSLWEQCGQAKTKEDWSRWLEETENPLKVDNQRYFLNKLRFKVFYVAISGVDHNSILVLSCINLY